MALSARMIWECRDTGSDTVCSGGYRGKKAVNAAPSSPSLSTATTGGTVAANTYYICITYTDPYGDTVMSGITSQVTTGATSTITVTAPGNASVTYNEQTVAVTSWSVYVGTLANGPFFPQGTGLTVTSNRVITATPPTSGTQPLGSSDYSQQNSRQINIDGATITATVQATTSQLKLTGTTVSAIQVGNTINITGGTMTAGVYEIIGIVGTDTWILDRSGGTSTQTGTGSMGGAFASIGQAYSVRVAGNTTYLKRGTADAPYNLSNSANVAGGKITSSSTEPITQEGPGKLIGYNSSRGDGGTDKSVWPIIQPNANTMNCISFSGSNQCIECLRIENGNANTTCTGITTSTSVQCMIRNVYVKDLSTGISNSGGGGSIIQCEADSCTLSAISGGSNVIPCFIMDCYAHDCSGNEAIAISRGAVINCIAANNTCDGFSGAQPGCYFVNCTAYGNSGGTSNGFSVTGTTYLINCLAVSSGGVGFNGASASAGFSRLINCAGYNNGGTGDVVANIIVKDDFIALSVDPFTDAASGDFSLNNAAGGGALLRAAGFPTVLPGLATTTNHLAVGAIQPDGSGVGGTSAPIIGSIMVRGGQ